MAKVIYSAITSLDGYVADEAGLVDEIHLFVTPVLVEGGNRALPSEARARLHLLDERRFDNGVVHLH